MSEVVAIIQARMTSTRLPGKVMMDLQGKPLLWHVLERVRRASRLKQVWIATTDDGTEAPILALCEQLGVSVWRGSTDDVLARYQGAAQAAKAGVVVRITSDCPLIDPQVIDRCVEAYAAAAPAVAYVSNCHQRTFPRGLDVEVFSRDALEAASREAVEPGEREHVTPFIWRRPERFPQGHLVDSEDHSHLRWTVDEPDDLRLIREVYAALWPDNPRFGYADVLRLVGSRPSLLEINAHVGQKHV
ncbi:MAG: glycosyltransferase family protein [Nitrospirota bacterium]|nr:glycosyltransferase family protein [Nitrospirota bacterium]